MALEVSKKKRKQRVVKGSYVEVDSIDAKPGNNYSNWIKITKDQLKIRESKLLQVKIEATNKILNGVLIKHNIQSPTFSVSDLIIDSALNSLYLTINNWKGLQLSRCKTPLNTYRDYWNKSKKWFDQSKKKTFGDAFWYEIFIYIDQFTNNNKNIILLMMSSLFNGTIDYNNTRKLFLINSSTATYSNKMQKYLQNLDDTLKINIWVINPFVLMKNIRAQLNILTSNLLTTLSNPTTDIAINVSANNTIPSSNANNNQSINHTNNNNNNNNSNMYVPVHNISHTVSDERYMPYFSSNNLSNNSNNTTVNNNHNAIYVINNNNNNTMNNNNNTMNNNMNNNNNTMNNNNGPVQAQAILIRQNGSVSVHNVQLVNISKPN